MDWRNRLHGHLLAPSLAVLAVDLLRETVPDRPGPAWELIESFDEDEVLGVSVHVICELRAGAERARKALHEHEEVDRLVSGLMVAYPDDRVPLMYGRLLAAIQRSGRAVASMDLLIGTAALMKDWPRRVVSGLRVSPAS